MRGVSLDVSGPTGEIGVRMGDREGLSGVVLLCGGDSVGDVVSTIDSTLSEVWEEGDGERGRKL